MSGVTVRLTENGMTEVYEIDTDDLRIHGELVNYYPSITDTTDEMQCLLVDVADEIDRLESERDGWKRKYFSLKNGIKEKLKELESYDTR